MSIISIIVPVYNVEKYIERIVRSIQKQSFSDWELILVDDCSPDNSGSIIDRYSQEDNRIVAKHHEKNRGPMVARQTGYLAATGDYIMFCDGDDELPVDAVKDLYETIVHKSVDIVVGGIEYVDINGNKSNFFCSELKYGKDRVSVFKSLLRKELKHNLCGRIYKRELFSDYQYEVYDNCNNSEDMVAFYQIIDHCNSIELIDDVVYYYHQNNSSSSLSVLSDKALNSMIFMRSLAVELLIKYPELENDMYNWLISDLSVLYPQYNKNGCLDKLIKQYGLSKYLKIGRLVAHGDLINVVKFVIKRHLL